MSYELHKIYMFLRGQWPSLLRLATFSLALVHKSQSTRKKIRSTRNTEHCCAPHKQYLVYGIVVLLSVEPCLVCAECRHNAGALVLVLCSIWFA